MSRREDLDGISERLRKSAVERAGDGGAGGSINSGPYDRLEHFAPINLLSLEARHREVQGQRRAARELLHPHGSLAFEADGAREPEERRNGIEQPTCGCGLERTDARAHHCQGVPVPIREREGGAHGIDEAVDLVEIARRGLHGVSRRGVTAGEPRRPQMRDPLESSLDTPDEDDLHAQW